MKSKIPIDIQSLYNKTIGAFHYVLSAFMRYNQNKEYSLHKNTVEYIRIPYEFVGNTNMAAVSLFW